MAGFYFGLPSETIDYTIDSWTNIDSDYPAANAKIQQNITTRTQTVDTTGSVLTVDLEAGYSALLIALDHVNFTGVQLEVDSAADFLSLQHDLSPTIGTNKATCWWELNAASLLATRRRLKNAWYLTGTDMRYLRLTIASQAGYNGEAFHFIGRLFVTDTVINKAPSWNLEYSPVTPTGVNEMKSGGREIYGESLFKQMEIELEWRKKATADESSIWQIDNIHPSQPLVIWNNEFSDAADFYVVQRADGGLSMKHGAPSYREFGTMNFIEAVSNP